MLYCDLYIDDVLVFAGMVCLNGAAIGNYGYLGFVGQLVFIDEQGTSDPSSPGLGTRFLLIYYVPGQPNLQVPLQDVPAQQFDVVLGSQNCTIALYEK